MSISYKHHTWQQVNHSWVVKQSENCTHLSITTNIAIHVLITCRSINFMIIFIFLLSRPFSSAIIRISRQCLHVCRSCVEVSRHVSKCLDVFTQQLSMSICLDISDMPILLSMALLHIFGHNNHNEMKHDSLYMWWSKQLKWGATWSCYAMGTGVSVIWCWWHYQWHHSTPYAKWLKWGVAWPLGHVLPLVLT